MEGGFVIRLPIYLLVTATTVLGMTRVTKALSCS